MAIKWSELNFNFQKMHFEFFYKQFGTKNTFFMIYCAVWKTQSNRCWPVEKLSLVDVDHYNKRWTSTVDVDATELFMVDVDQTELFHWSTVDIWRWHLTSTVDIWRRLSTSIFTDVFITPIYNSTLKIQKPDFTKRWKLLLLQEKTQIKLFLN